MFTHASVNELRHCWKRLILTDLAYNLLAIAVLTPLFGLLFRAMVSFSGDAVLSDTDILFFFIRPLGLLCLVVAGAVWLGILALGQTSLLAILCAQRESKTLGVFGALRFSWGHVLPVIYLTLRLVAYTLAVAAPFLVVAAGVYVWYLSEFDINYYLQQKPPEFLTAVGIGVVLVVALAGTLIWLYSGWLFALPIMLFEHASPGQAVRSSVGAVRGRRRKVVGWIVGWLLATTVVASVVSGLVTLLGHTIVPSEDGSLRLMAVTIGVTLVVLFLANQIVSLFSTLSFAAIHFGLYRTIGASSEAAKFHINVEDLEREPTTRLISYRWRWILLAVGFVVSMIVGASAVRAIQVDDRVEIMAHRGSSKAAPENTLAAVRQAIADQTDWVEIDVQETADGEVVVFHDSDFMKLAGSDLKIWDATREDLAKLDIGSWFSDEFSEERVPTLDEVLRVCKGKTKVNIELKYYGHDQQLEQRVAEIVEANHMQDDVILMSLKREAVTKMKSLRPDWKVGLLMSVSIGDLGQLDADFLAVNAQFAGRTFVDRAHRLDKEVFVWTVNDAATMSVMISRGVDGLITDKPALARSVLRQRAEMTGPQRLLLEFAGWLGIQPELGEE